MTKEGIISIIKKGIFVLLSGALLFNSALFVSRVFSYDTNVAHPVLTEKIAQNYNNNFERKLSAEQINWLKQGSIEEDTPPRWMNHFFEPNLNRGLWNFSSAKNWAQSPNLQTVYLEILGRKGNQSWQKAIDAFSQGDEKSSFIALGHALHLIEDMSVPAHTRLDAHPEGDPYEKWAKGNSEKEIKKTNQIISSSNLSEIFDKLANYSNQYFLSKDTINSNIFKNRESFKKKSGEIVVNCIKGDSVLEQDACIVAYIISKFGKKTYYIDDPIVHSDYFSLLAPKAIAYGSGAIKLFFEEADKKKQEQEQESWWKKIKNWLNKNTQNFSSSLLNLTGDNIGQKITNQETIFNENALNNLANQNNVSQENSEQEQDSNEIISTKQDFEPQIEQQENISERQNAENNEQSENQNNENDNQKNNNQDNEIQEQNQNNESGQNTQENQENADGQNNQESNEENQQGNNQAENNNLPATSTSGTNPQPQENNFSPDTTSPDTTFPDTTPPETSANSVLFSNNQTIATSTAIFGFSSSETNSTFECQLDNASSTPCFSPQNYYNLSDGTHNFQVKAIDQAGNYDQTPVVFDWIIDTVAPSISNILVSNITSNSAQISFVTDKPTYAKIEYGINIAYGEETIWEMASTTNHVISLTSLSSKTSYYFRICAKDDLGNKSDSENNIFTTAEGLHIVISEIQLSGAGGANDEWIELYNPTDQPIDLFSWSIQYRGGAATTFNKKNFTATSTIPAQSFFLIANNNYTGGAPADMVYSSGTFSLSGNGGNIFLVNDQTTLLSATSTSIVDKISYGTGTNLFPEGIGFIPSPASGESLERKANATSTAESLSVGSDKWQGNSYDSNDNSQDFVLQNSPTPQNSRFLTEPRSSFPSLAVDSAWPMFQKNQKHQAQTEIAPNDLIPQLLVNDSSLYFFTPPIISQNKIFVGAGTGVYAFDLSGNQLWFYPSGKVDSLIAASNGSIYLSANNGFFCISNDGVLIWKYVSAIGGYLNIDKNGAIYIVSGSKLYSFYPDGKSKWIFDVSNPPLNRNVDGAHFGFPAIDNNRERIYANIGEYLYSFNFKGSLQWSFRNDDSFQSIPTHVFTTPSIDNEGTIYVCSDGEVFPSGGVYALNPNGTVKWFSASGYNSDATSASALVNNDTVYFAVNSGLAQAKLFAFDINTGREKWNVSTFDPWMSSPIVIGSNIYLAAGREVRSFDVDGNMVWHWNEGSGSYLDDGFGAIDDNGNIYFSVKEKLYKIGN